VRVDTSIDAPSEFYLNSEYWFPKEKGDITTVLETDDIFLTEGNDYTKEIVGDIYKFKIINESFNGKTILFVITQMKDEW